MARSMLLVAVALAMTVAPVSSAQAQMLRCKYNYTDTRDHAALRGALQQALPSKARIEPLPTICRNPGSARAWLSTTPRLRGDGVTEWWDLACHRDTGEWACEVPVHRQLIWVYTEVAGKLRRLETQFDDATGLELTRALAVRAMQILSDPGAEPPAACRKSAEAQDRSFWEKSRSAFWELTKDSGIELSIEADEDGSIDVITNAGTGPLALHFTGTNDGPVGQVCWALWIVVT